MSQVFLSYTWADEAEVDAVEAALRARGVNVFRDKDIETFAPITGEILRALESATVLLAFYSRRYPTRYACQWELTWAFLAARRLGNPSDRLLLVNPEADEQHIAPIDLEDAAYFTWTRESDAGLLADRVVARMAAVGETPFGPLPDTSPGEFHERLTRPRRFVGRYPEMWDIHSALHSGTRWAVHPPEPHSAVVVTGPAGMGKTMLAEQYGFLFRDAYPGGMVWTDLAGDGRRPLPELMHSAVSEVAEDRFGLDLRGVTPPQARTMLAERFTDAGADVLWVVDDIPEGVPVTALDALVIPSSRVHMVLTARAISPEWPVRRMAVGGLTEVEGEELFRARWGRLGRDERQAVARLVRRCHGHPLVLVPAVTALRGARGTGAVDQVFTQVDQDPVVTGLVDAIRARSAHARVVLGFAAVLAQAPFGGDLLVDGVSEVLGVGAPTLVAQAIDELEQHSLLRRVDRGHATGRQAWQLHPLVAAATRRHLDGPFLDRFAVRAARILLGALASAGLDHCRHALTVVENPAVPLDERLELLRLVAVRYEDHGDLLAARDCRYEVVRAAGSSWRMDDVLAAARLAAATGDTAVTLRHTAAVVERSRAVRDVPAEYRARLLAATAHDLLGAYTVADTEFHAHDLVQAEGVAPTWMPEDERRMLSLARVRALRLRGDYRAATDLLGELLPEIQLAHPLGGHRGVWPVAMVEHARLLLLTGEVKKSRKAAHEVVDVFADAGLLCHPLAYEAVTVHAEGELVLALSEIKAQPVKWELAAKRVKRVLAESRELHGEENPLTLELAVIFGQALHRGSQPEQARAELTAAEKRIAATLGVEHPLALRARQWIGLTMAVRGEWAAATRIFENLLPRQETALGRGHPDSQLSRLELGICLAMGGRSHELQRARRLIDEAMRSLRDQHGPWHEWSTVAMSGVVFSRLPAFAWRMTRWLDRRIGARRS